MFLFSGAASSSATKGSPDNKSGRGSGIDFADLPARYRRKAIPQDEMECIEVIRRYGQLKKFY